jgi:thioredoxin 1
MIQSIIHTNQQSIDRVLQTGLPVVLAFWSHQAQLNPTVETLLAEAARQQAGKLLIAKIDAQAEQPLLARFGVQQAPTLVFIKGGQVEGSMAGGADADGVRAWLHYLVQGGARPAVAQAQRTTNGAHPVTLTDANFAQTLNDNRPVLVDFWAPWCGPCRMVAPAVEQLAREFQGRAVIGKLNVDENPQTAQRFGIQSIPTLLIFRQGKVVDQIVGAQPAHVLHQRLARFAS